MSASNLIFKRVFAFAIDYGVIISYASLLFFISSTFFKAELNPVEGQVVGFLTLTLPVFLYFFFLEKSKWKATLGKYILNIKVEKTNKNTHQHILKRNVLKFLPWELAHTGVHWMVYYSSKNIEVPIWVWVFLILPQIIMIFYAISLITSRGRTCFYDRLAGTAIVSR